MSIIRTACSALIAAGLVAGMSAAASAKELKASVHLPPKNNTVADGWEPFAEQVKAATAGEVTVKLFLGGSLLGPKAASEGIRDGVVDLGYVIVGYHPAEFPHTAFINDMAAIGTNAVIVTAATTELIMTQCEPCLVEYKQRGNVYTGTYAVPPMVIMSTKMIDSPDDIKGLKIRSAGAAWDNFVNAVGATPVNVPSSEQYEAMSRGVVDASFHVAASLKTYGLWDMTKDVLLVNVGAYRAINTFAFNPDSWSDLTDDQRRIVLEAASDANFGIAAGYIRTDNEALKESQDKGIRVQEISDAFKAIRADYVANEKKGLITKGKETRGVANPEPLIEQMSALVDKWTAIYEEVGGDVDAMRARFKTDVISKIDVSTYGK
ncbi:MAG: C4-dicarboxylate TRAP transporter substrate-binding protein [Minwuia sp.]|uniref:C4-dicarboxylate TRAP transporter substrate-binding protein n=1 Tax=Minwuia sp. TaxID=2493630 RepID=UPI003A87F870